MTRLMVLAEMVRGSSRLSAEARAMRRRDSVSDDCGDEEGSDPDQHRTKCALRRHEEECGQGSIGAGNRERERLCDATREGKDQ